MPFSNPYNAQIKDKLKNIAYAKVAHLKQHFDFIRHLILFDAV